jgi:two-component system NtrC family sensor kinase
LGTDSCKYKILIVEDDNALCVLIKRRLEKAGFKSEFVNNGCDALAYLRNDPNVIMLLDYQLGDMTAVGLVGKLVENDIDVPFIIITGQGSETVAVETMKLGARDYITKGSTFIGMLPKVVSRVADELALERKLATTEEALRKEKTHLLNNIPDMVFQIDNEGRLTSFNPSVVKILGYGSDELFGRYIYDFIHPEERKTARKDHKAVKKGQNILRHPIRFVRNDGSVRWLEGNIVPIYDQSDSSVGISAIYQDITEKKIALDRLKEANDKISLLLDTSPSMILEFDKDFKLISSNRAGKDFFKFRDSGGFYGISYEDLFGLRWSNDAFSALESARHGNSTRMTVRMPGPSAQNTWFDIIFSPVRSAQGDIKSIMATAWNVSERVEREINIKKSLLKKERSAQEATILQNISLSAGSGADIDPKNVVISTLNSVASYIYCDTAMGYLFDEQGRIEKVIESENSSMHITEAFDSLLTKPSITGTISKLRTPRVLSRIKISELEEIDGKIRELFEATSIVPLVNAGKSFGFLIFVGVNKIEMLEALPFCRSVSNCAGVAIANAKMLNGVSEKFRSRFSSLEDYSHLVLSDSEQEQLQKVLETIIESAVNFVQAKSGLVILYNRPSDLLHGIAGYNLSSEELSSIRLHEHKCITRHSVLNSTMVYCPDITKTDEYVCDGLANITQKSLLAIPLLDNGQCIGLLVILDQIVEFDDSCMGVLKSLAELAVQSINNARLAQKSAEMDRKLEKLRKISRSITSSKDINTAIKQLCKSAIDISGGKLAWTAMLDRDNKKLKYAAHAGENYEFVEGLEVDIEGPEASYCAAVESVRSTQPVILTALSNEGGVFYMARQAGFESCCAVPIMNRGVVYGSLIIYHPERGSFTNTNINILEEFCDQAAIAISNLHLRRNLLESESLKNIILQSVNEALLVVDFAGTVMSANMAFERLFECDFLEFKNKPYRVFFSEGHPIAEVISQWLVSREDQAECEGWTELNDKMHYLTVETKNVDIEQVPCLLLTIRDLTMQKKINASLEHAEKLTTAGRLASQVAHEIGNPLTLISSQIQRMIYNKQAEPKRLKELLGHIDRISGLIKRFSNLERKQNLSVNLERVEPLIDNIISLVANTKSFEEIKIVKNLASPLPKVNIEKSQITQVILNLILNAADACGGVGVIIINGYVKSVSIETNNEQKIQDYLVISVTDSGCGIDSETLKHIFEPFYTTKEPNKGTGLGLSVSLSIIDQHRGWINVDSKAGEGSTFSIYLPIENFDLSEKLRIAETDYLSKNLSNRDVERARQGRGFDT